MNDFRTTVMIYPNEKATIADKDQLKKIYDESDELKHNVFQFQDVVISKVRVSRFNPKVLSILTAFVEKSKNLNMLFIWDDVEGGSYGFNLIRDCGETNFNAPVSYDCGDMDFLSKSLLATIGVPVTAISNFEKATFSLDENLIVVRYKNEIVSSTEIMPNA